jgi:arginyl-tRNA synthetase
MRAKNHLQNLLQRLTADKGFSWPDKVSIEIPREKQHGDMATNLAMVLAGQAGRKPRDLAEELRDELRGLDREIERIEVAGPGFLNFFFSPGFWQETVRAVRREGSEYGSSAAGEGRSVLVEYVSANPTGPLHIGHGRGAAVGDSLTRILRFSGYDVTTEYYLNDVGTQMELLGRSIWLRYQQHCGRDVTFPDSCYQGEYIRGLASEVYREYGPGLLERGEQEALDLCRRWGAQRITESIRRDLGEFRAEHQSWFSERTLVDRGAVQSVLQRLQDRGLAYEAEGALWFRTTEYGDDKDRVLRKSDGELTYFASDIAYHEDKFARGFGLAIDVWGADHHGYVPRMQAAVQGLGRRASDLEVVLIQLVNLVREGRYVTMSTRAGKFETLADISREVGVDAARFIFLSRKSDSPLDFDLDLLKQQSMDNPVYYVQYAHARICSMLAKAEERGVIVREPSAASLEALSTPEDMELLKTLDRFPDTVLGAARTLSPHHVTYYLQDLAGMLHRYYNKHRVLGAGGDDTVQDRIQLMLSVARVLRNGLRLLGVSAPEQM